MVHADYVLDRNIGAARPQPVVKLILAARDLQESLSFTMYNVVQQGLAAARGILEGGGTVGIECQARKGSAPIHHWILSSPGELDPWRDAINRVVIQAHPVPRIQPLDDQRATRPSAVTARP